MLALLVVQTSLHDPRVMAIFRWTAERPANRANPVFLNMPGMLLMTKRRAGFSSGNWLEGASFVISLPTRPSESDAQDSFADPLIRSALYSDRKGTFSFFQYPVIGVRSN
jgi:hypothetical protein